MLHSILSSLASYMYLSICSLAFIFIQGSAVRKKNSSDDKFFLFLNYQLVWSSIWHLVFCLYFKISEYLMRLILEDSFWFVFNWNNFEMRLFNLRIIFIFYLLRTFCPHLGSFFVLFLLSLRFGQISPLAFFRWFLPRPRIGMMSLVTVSPVITAFHSCCLSHHDFDQVNLWPAWVGFETAIFWQCSTGTVETQYLYPLRQRWNLAKT